MPDLAAIQLQVVSHTSPCPIELHANPMDDNTSWVHLDTCLCHGTGRVPTFPSLRADCLHFQRCGVGCCTWQEAPEDCPTCNGGRGWGPVTDLAALFRAVDVWLVDTASVELWIERWFKAWHTQYFEPARAAWITVLRDLIALPANEEGWQREAEGLLVGVTNGVD